MNSRIRVDNLQDVAILEYRSSEGEVIRQYPTPAQIQAFKRAEEIATEVRGQTAQSSASAPAENAGDGPSPASSAESSAPAAEAAAPVAQASAPSYAPPAAGGKSTQSVVV